MKGLLRYCAGDNAYRLIRSQGFDLQQVQALAGPASGPKWLALAGIDRALISAGLLSRRPAPARRLLLVGASAGAWRMLAMACRDPITAHAALQEGYIGQVFARRITQMEVSKAYREMLAGIFTREQTDRIFDHPACDTGAHVVRVRGPAGSTLRIVQAAAFLAAAGLNALSARTMRLWFKPVLLHTSPARFDGSFAGPVVQLGLQNLHAAALASGSVPLYFDPVRAIPGAPRGRYLDGGLVDYHLNTTYLGSGGGVTLLPHFQKRIVPNWFDRYYRRRRPDPRMLADVLQIYPSPDFIAGLPGARIPDRSDFMLYTDNPKERIRRWQLAVRESDRLGEQLLHDLSSGAIPNLVERI